METGHENPKEDRPCSRTQVASIHRFVCLAIRSTSTTGAISITAAPSHSGARTRGKALPFSLHIDLRHAELFAIRFTDE